MQSAEDPESIAAIGGDQERRGPSLDKKLACRRYYKKNCEKLKEKSRQRAKAVKEYQKMHETPAEVADRKERHRLASAKYRQRNRKEISEKERKRRPGYQKWLADHQKRAAEGDEFSQWVVSTED